MERTLSVGQIEKRARLAGVSVSEVCRRADVHPTTFFRWKRSLRTSDAPAATLRSLTKITAALYAIEAEAKDQRKAVGA